MDYTRIELRTIVAGAVLLLSMLGVGHAQAPTKSFELLEATIPDLQAAMAGGSVKGPALGVGLWS